MNKIEDISMFEKYALKSGGKRKKRISETAFSSLFLPHSLSVSETREKLMLNKQFRARAENILKIILISMNVFFSHF